MHVLHGKALDLGLVVLVFLASKGKIGHGDLFDAVAAVRRILNVLERHVAEGGFFFAHRRQLDLGALEHDVGAVRLNIGEAQFAALFRIKCLDTLGDCIGVSCHGRAAENQRKRCTCSQNTCRWLDIDENLHSKLLPNL